VIHATFNIKKDMTPEEEEVAVRELHAWQLLIGEHGAHP